MDGKQNDQRWFLIKHDKCQAVFTLEVNSFIESYESRQHVYSDGKHIWCPNCCESILIADDVLKSFKKYKSVCDSKDVSIKEVNPKDLKICNPDNASRFFLEL